MLPEFGANQLPVVSRPQGLGKVFYVDHNTGDDDNNGVDPSTPFKLIAYALEQCVSNRNDYIIVLDCWNADTFPIVVNKSRVHIIGLAMGALVPIYYPVMTAGAAAAIFQIGGGMTCVEIAGFDLQTAGGPCIDVSGIAYGHWIHHMKLGKSGAAQDGILLDTAGDELSLSLVEDCLFGSLLTRDGIRCEPGTAGTLTFSLIRNNIFRRYGGIGINAATAAPAAVAEGFIGNKFFKAETDAGVSGWAITIVQGRYTMVDDNHAMTQTDVPGTNPYRDFSNTPAVGFNAWGLNYMGILATYPAIA